MSPARPRSIALFLITDLSVIQHGSKLLIRFTVPTDTTEDLPLKTPPTIELRIGPAPAGPFAFPAWQKASDLIPVSTPGSAQVDIGKYVGKTEIIGVKAHGPNGQDAGWSRLESVAVVSALAAPEGLEAKDAPDAVRLDWHAAAPGFRIFRDSKQVGTSDKPFYLDTGIEAGKTYRYAVQSIEMAGDKYAESDLSPEISFQPTDTFPPAVPAGVTAVPGTRTIELVWERNVEKDFASYRVYRDGKKIADGLTAPAYSDKDVKPSVSYSYRVSAVDATGNESAQSAAVEATIP